MGMFSLASPLAIATFTFLIAVRRVVRRPMLALRLLAVCLARFAACLVLAMFGIPGSGLKSEA